MYQITQLYTFIFYVCRFLFIAVLQVSPPPPPYHELGDLEKRCELPGGCRLSPAVNPFCYISSFLSSTINSPIFHRFDFIISDHVRIVFKFSKIVKSARKGHNDHGPGTQAAFS